MPLSPLPSSETTWSAFARRWSRLKPPLRPHPDVCGKLRELLDGSPTRALLLGVTPELVDLARYTVAIDSSGQMLSAIWPGNTSARHAVKGIWTELPCSSGCFSAVIGDGSVNCLEYPEAYRNLFGELARVTQAGGCIAIRVFLTPDGCESVETVRRSTLAGGIGSIHALKWRLAHAACAQRGNANLPVQAILDVFNREFPDRHLLAAMTGWRQDEIAQLDTYDRMPDTFSFPSASQLLSTIPRWFRNVRFVAAGGYEMAERCPLLVMERTA